MPPDLSGTAFEIRMRDPLAELLGSVPEGYVFSYRLEDMILMTGHLCPTVTGAYLAAWAAIRKLYGDEPGRRGEVVIDIPGAVTDGSNGPISQVFTFITGGAAENGFGGLGGRFRRRGLLRFHPDDLKPWTFYFSRTDTGASVAVTADLGRVPPDPELGVHLQTALGEGTTDRTAFQRLWNERIRKLVRQEWDKPGSIVRAETAAPQHEGGVRS